MERANTTYRYLSDADPQPWSFCCCYFLSFLDLHHWQLWYISMLFQVVKEEMVESCILDEETMVEMTLSSALPSISTVQQVS